MPAWVPAAIGAGASIIGGITSANAQRRAAESAREWGQYNAVMGHQTAVDNVVTRAVLAEMELDLSDIVTDIQTQAIEDSTAFNSEMILATSRYNAGLLEQELNILWEAVDLDLMQLEQQRARERGAIVANQAASGTVIDEGSNAKVIIDQRTQEELDSFIIRHGANHQAAKILNAKATTLWQGQAEAKRVVYEGDVATSLAENNERIKRIGTTAGVAISGLSSLTSARYTLMAGLGGAEVDYSASIAMANNTLTQGLFSGASQAADAYYKFKNPGP